MGQLLKLQGETDEAYFYRCASIARGHGQPFDHEGVDPRSAEPNEHAWRGFSADTQDGKIPLLQPHLRTKYKRTMPNLRPLIRAVVVGFFGLGATLGTRLIIPMSDAQANLLWLGWIIYFEIISLRRALRR